MNDKTDNMFVEPVVLIEARSDGTRILRSGIPLPDEPANSDGNSLCISISANRICIESVMAGEAKPSSAAGWIASPLRGSR